MSHSTHSRCGRRSCYCVELHGDVVEQSLSKEINYSEAFQPEGLRQSLNSVTTC